MEDFKFKIAGKNYTTKVVEEEGGSLLVTVNGKTYQVELPGRTPAPKPVIRPAGGVAAAPVAAPAPKAAPAPAAAPAPKAAPAGANAVTAPLPGTITQILVKVGQQIKAGDTVVMMEAMKMENSITAEYDGTVKAILVQQGAQVQSGEALVEMA